MRYLVQHVHVASDLKRDSQLFTEVASNDAVVRLALRVDIASLRTAIISVPSIRRDGQR